MNSDQYIWRVWKNNLHRWGIEAWVASLLEAAGPMTILGAQAVYLGEPLLKFAIPHEHLEAAARLLEDSSQTRAFAAMLQEDVQRELV